MNSTVSVSELQDRAPEVVKRAERNGSVAVSRHGRTVAFVVSRERMEAILETVEIMADRDLMTAIGNFEQAKMKAKAFDPNRI